MRSYRENPGEVHAKSVALMRYLAQIAAGLGVADDVYVVGGAVRNWVLGEPIKDIDVVIDSVSSGVDSETFARALARSIPVPTSLVTNQYGVAILTVKGHWDLDGHDMSGEVMEIANARAESYAKGGEGKGYKPSEVRPATISEDVYRREFRFNTLLWRMADLADGPEGAGIIDLTGRGLDDLKAGRICTPGSPDVTFSDDPTRMLRAVKFALRYGFSIPESVADSIRRNAEMLRVMPWEPVATLFINNVLRTDGAIEGIPMLQQLGMIDVLIEMAQDPPMAAFLNRQLRNEQRPEVVILLLDSGFDLDTPLASLGPDQRERFVDLIESMGDDESEAYFAAFQKPPVNNMEVISALDLAPAARRNIAPMARVALLADPSLADDPKQLTQRVIDIWPQYVANGKWGLVLDEESKMALIQWWRARVGPLLPRVYAHHMTIGNERWRSSLGIPIGAEGQLHVVGWADDGKAQAVRVESSVPSVNVENPHVTVATSDGVQPVYSNELLERGARRVDGPYLRGYVEVIP